MFEPAWSERTVEDDPGAPFFNDTTKVRCLIRYRKADMAQLGSGRPLQVRHDPEPESGVGNLYVSGSISLVQGLLADGLVDRLHIFIYPITLGKGTRLFPEGGGEFKMSLEASDSYANGVVYGSYRPDNAS